MNQFGITNKSWYMILDVFSKYPEVEEVVLFGSRAKGNFKKGSDIDLSIKGDHCNVETALQISSIMNEELPIPYHVDIVNYKTIFHRELKDHIDRVGITVLQNKPVIKN